MATAVANRPIAPTVAPRSRGEPRPQPLGAELVNAPPKRLPSGGGAEEIAALVAGSGIFLIQACAVTPGLLPCLALLLLLVLPLVVLGAAVGLLLALPVGMWRLAAVARRSRAET
jgi:hypothetical protein